LKKIIFSIFSLIAICTISACSSNESDHEKMNHTHSSTSTVTDSTAKAKFSYQDNILNIQIVDDNNKPIKKFDVEHEKLLHLIIVSKDLSYFHHIHPTYKGNGVFTIDPEFPSDGTYKLYADYVPTGGSKTVSSKELTVGNGENENVPLKTDTSLTKFVDGKEITLSFDHLMENMDSTMTFTIKDAKTKKDITNLEPYLGAVGHVVAISQDTNTYLHVHPMNENSKGPKAEFMTTFSKSGFYKIWSQFKQDGKVFTVPFVINVEK